MDYIRIYDAFIKDRRAKASTLTGYTEKHHVMPRCMGGSDEAENLVRLTAEDHFFAHLLLAKIHGGQMWAPMAFMVGGTRKDYKPILSRKAFGWVKRAMASGNVGDCAHQFDWAEHSLRHMDGRSWAGKQSEIIGALGVSKSLANMLIKGRVKSAKGWYLAGRQRPERGGDSHPMYRGEAITFLHVDGRRFVGTQHDLSVAHGLSRSMACRLARGQFRSAKGWYVEGTEPAKVGRGAKWKIAG